MPSVAPESQTTFHADFSGTIAPFVVAQQTGGATIIPHATSVEFLVVSTGGDEILTIVSPAPLFDPTIQDFCFCATDIPHVAGTPATNDVPLAFGVVGLLAGHLAAIVIDPSGSNYVFVSIGPGGVANLPLMPIDTSPHSFRVCGNATTQSYFIIVDGGAPIPYVPPAGQYPQEPMSALVHVTAGAGTTTDVDMDDYCLQYANAPGSLMLAPEFSGAEQPISIKFTVK